MSSILLATKKFLGGEEGNRLISSVQHVIAISAIISAAVWFLQKNEHAPMLNVVNVVTQHTISPGFRLVRIELKVENVGKVPLKVSTGVVKLHQVTPLAGKPKDYISKAKTLYELDDITIESKTISWPLISKREIESSFEIRPGEIEMLPFEFVIPDDIIMVQVSSELYQLDERLVWSRQTYYQN